jgi:hypothetical protein
MTPHPIPLQTSLLNFSTKLKKRLVSSTNSSLRLRSQTGECLSGKLMTPEIPNCLVSNGKRRANSKNQYQEKAGFQLRVLTSMNALE